MGDYQGLRILVVDDDPLMLDLLARAVVRLGAPAPLRASDGAGGLAVVESEPVDIVLCDIDMPGMDGMELLRHLAARPAAPAVVIVSGTSDPVLRAVADLGHAHRLRVLGALTKPALPRDIEPLFDRFLAPVSASGRSSAPREMVDDAELVPLIATGLEVHYQPLYSLTTGRLESVEALARLRRPDGRVVSPAVFVPACERLGESGTLLFGVLDRALLALVELRAGGEGTRLSVNLSADDLVDTALVDQIEARMQAADLPLTALTVELTEARIMPDTPAPVEILTRLRVHGVGLSIDDYGTGFSSLKQLKRLPFTELKIDQTFVRGAHADARTRTILASTIELAHELDLRTVAEGVETAEDLDLVRSLGCDVAQGYFLARPMPLADLLGFLRGTPPSHERMTPLT